MLADGLNWTWMDMTCLAKCHPSHRKSPCARLRKIQLEHYDRWLECWQINSIRLRWTWNATCHTKSHIKFWYPLLVGRGEWQIPLHFRWVRLSVPYIDNLSHFGCTGHEGWEHYQQYFCVVLLIFYTRTIKSSSRFWVTLMKSKFNHPDDWVLFCDVQMMKHF